MNRRESAIVVVALGAAAGLLAPSLNEGEVCDVPTRRTGCVERQASNWILPTHATVGDHSRARCM